ncbi:hypothetical protein B6U91_00700 [Candidatus Pacearchaeota archaeon ex4484_71]|nr:MAG: hypothetical protein B6U91_00700 [Candidatus Pacearchaeota archaeon ex4484_71]
MRKRTFGILLLAVFVLSGLGILFSYFHQGIFYQLLQNDPAPLIASLKSMGIIGALLFVFLVVLENVVAPLPPFILYVAGGAIYGGIFGGLLALLGNALGSAIAFFIARKLGREWVERKVPEKVRKRFDRFSSKYGGFAIFLLRVNPVTSTDLFSYLGGFTKMSFKSFIIGTTLGLAPSIILQTYLGDFFSSSPILFNLFIVVGVFYIVLFAFLFFLYKIKKKKDIEMSFK